MRNLLLITLLSLLSVPSFAGTNAVNFDPNDVKRSGTIILNRDNTLSLINPLVRTSLSCRKSGYRTYRFKVADVKYPETRLTHLRRLTYFETYSAPILMEQGDITRKVFDACQRGLTRMPLDYQIVGICIKTKAPGKGRKDYKFRTRTIITDLDCR